MGRRIQDVGLMVNARKGDVKQRLRKSKIFAQLLQGMKIMGMRESHFARFSWTPGPGLSMQRIYWS
jgi:hypothetical protein